MGTSNYILCTEVHPLAGIKKLAGYVTCVKPYGHTGYHQTVSGKQWPPKELHAEEKTNLAQPDALGELVCERVSPTLEVG